jgi:hypothetical protein
MSYNVYGVGWTKDLAVLKWSPLAALLITTVVSIALDRL